jgi:DNA-binding GntR family transcriptional regulator
MVNIIDRQPKPERVRLVDTAYAALLPRIVRLEIAPGEPIDEKALAQELGVGRQPVRAALTRLEFDGLVTVYPQRGTFASQIRLEDLGSITEVRLELEGLAARLAAQRASAAQKEHLDELAELSATAVTPVDEVDSDAAVHRLVFEMSRNTHLITTLDHYFNLALRMWYVATRRGVNDANHVHVDHRPLAAAISRGERGEAEHLLQEHIARDSRVVRDILSPS